MSTFISNVSVHGLTEAEVDAVFATDGHTWLRIGPVTIHGGSSGTAPGDLIDRAAAFHRLASEAGKVAEELTRQAVARQVSA